MKTSWDCLQARLLVLLVALHSQTAHAHVVAYPGQPFVGPQPHYGGFFTFFHPSRYVPAPAPSYQPAPQLHQYPAYIMHLVPDVKPLDTPHKVIVQKLPPRIESLVQRIQNIYSYYNYENHHSNALRDGNSTFSPQTLPVVTQRPFTATSIPTTSGGNTQNQAHEDQSRYTNDGNVYGEPTVKPIQGLQSENSQFSTNIPQNTESYLNNNYDGSQSNVNQISTTTDKPDSSFLPEHGVASESSQTRDNNINQGTQNLSSNNPTIVGLIPPHYSSSSDFKKQQSSDHRKPANLNPDDTGSTNFAGDIKYGAPLNVNSKDDSQYSQINNSGAQDNNAPGNGRPAGIGLREYGTPFVGNVDQSRNLEWPQISGIPHNGIPVRHYLPGSNKQNQWNSNSNINNQGYLRPDVHNIYNGIRNQDQDKRPNGEQSVHHPDFSSGNGFQMNPNRPSFRNYFTNYMPVRGAISSDQFSTNVQMYNYDTPSHPYIYPPNLRSF